MLVDIWRSGFDLVEDWELIGVGVKVIAEVWCDDGQCSGHIERCRGCGEWEGVAMILNRCCGCFCVVAWRCELLEGGFDGRFELCEAFDFTMTRCIALDDSLVVVRPHDLSRGEVDEEAAHGDLKIDNCILCEG